MVHQCIGGPSQATLQLLLYFPSSHWVLLEVLQPKQPRPFHRGQNVPSFCHQLRQWLGTVTKEVKVLFPRPHRNQERTKSLPFLTDLLLTFKFFLCNPGRKCRHAGFPCVKCKKKKAGYKKQLHQWKSSIRTCWIIAQGRFLQRSIFVNRAQYQLNWVKTCVFFIGLSF